MKESELMKRVMIRATNFGARLFRNNVAKGWIGKTEVVKNVSNYRLYPGDVVIHKARRLNSGLAVGSSDLVGWMPVKITQDMIGQTFAIFLAVECKVGKYKTTPEQDNFINAVNAMGGRALVIRDHEQTIDNELTHIKTNAGGKF